jgi:hypothetical protein
MKIKDRFGGERGIRSLGHPLDSVSYTNHIARNARNASVAVGSCSFLPAEAPQSYRWGFFLHRRGSMVRIPVAQPTHPKMRPVTSRRPDWAKPCDVERRRRLTGSARHALSSGSAGVCACVVSSRTGVGRSDENQPWHDVDHRQRGISRERVIERRRFRKRSLDTETRPNRVSARRVTMATLTRTRTSVDSHSRRTNVTPSRIGGASILAITPGAAPPADQRAWPSVPAGNTPLAPHFPERRLPRQD